MISEPIPCVALIVNSVSLCFLSPRAVNINVCNWCLELVFKVRPGLFTPPVPWLAKSSSVQVGKQELRHRQVPTGSRSAAGSALGLGKTSPSPGLGAALPWSLPLSVFYGGGGWGKF